MHIEFPANGVSYSDAIDGEIVQALFQEDEEEDGSDPLLQNYKYLLIQTNYEFPSPAANAEWFDGEEYGGGSLLVAYRLDPRMAVFQLENGYIFEIGYRADPLVLENIRSYLTRHCIELET